MRYIFAYINFFDNILYQYPVDGNTWQEAYKNGIETYYKHKYADQDMKEDIEYLLDKTIEEAQCWAFDNEFQFSLYPIC